MIISNNALQYFEIIPKNLIVRINVAWIKTIAELETIIKNSSDQIYLDYPYDRKKYPKSKLSLNKVIQVANNSSRVQYFAVSNAEQSNILEDIRNKLKTHIQIIPKIESVKGIRNLQLICKAASTNIIMLDKEDLYYSLKRNNKQFIVWINKLNKEAKIANIKILRLQGVIFDYDK